MTGRLCSLDSTSGYRSDCPGLWYKLIQVRLSRPLWECTRTIVTDCLCSLASASRYRSAYPGSWYKLIQVGLSGVLVQVDKGQVVRGLGTS